MSSGSPSERPAPGRRLARGLGASPGRATGELVFTSDRAVERAKGGTPVIFVRIETATEDIAGMKVAAGIVTTRGGLTGDAAIVARTLGKPCVAGCAGLQVDYAARTLGVFSDDHPDSPLEKLVLHEGDSVTIDGQSGEVFAG